MLNTGKGEREGFLASISLHRQYIERDDVYPFNLPILRGFKQLNLHPSVTYLIGENGSGKSTLLEAMAVKAGFNPEGGTKDMQFATYESHSELYSHLRLQRNYRKERDGFFLRAESFYNVSSELDRREREYGRALRHYGEKSLHMQSHGEAFLSLINYRFGDESLFFLDEPEAALSPARQLSLLVQIDRLANFGSQFIIATHSPILMSYPNSTMYFLSEEGITETTWTETEHYQLTKTFLNAPEAFLKRLFVEPK